METVKMNISTKAGRDAIVSKLTEVQVRCKARTIDIMDIERILGIVELNCSKKALTGTKVVYDGGMKFTSAYKYTPESTHFSAEFNGKAWIVTDIYRDACPNRVTSCSVSYSDTAKQDIINKLSRF